MWWCFPSPFPCFLTLFCSTPQAWGPNIWQPAIQTSPGHQNPRTVWSPTCDQTWSAARLPIADQIQLSTDPTPPSINHPQMRNQYSSGTKFVSTSMFRHLLVKKFTLTSLSDWNQPSMLVYSGFLKTPFNQTFVKTASFYSSNRTQCITATTLPSSGGLLSVVCTVTPILPSQRVSQGSHIGKDCRTTLPQQDNGLHHCHF